MFPHWSTPGLQRASYTPVWTSASGTAPAIGNGTLTGSYMRFDRLVVANLRLQSGSTTTFGDANAQWSFTLPFTAVEIGGAGSLWLHDDASSWTGGVVHIATTTTVIPYYALNGNGVHATYPFTWASPDRLRFTITYEAAS